jgi:integrase
MELFTDPIAETTLKLYTSNLKRLNGGVLPKGPAFLKKTDDIQAIIDKYATNTKKSYYITIVSYLKGKKVPKKTSQYYYDKMTNSNKEYLETSSQKTPKQEANWMNWEDIVAHYKTLKPGTLEHLLLSLYVLIPPRRSKDYYLMKVVPEYNESMDKAFNYLDWKEKKFIFNNYKTQGKYGAQVVDIPPELWEVLSQMKLKKKFEPFFLLNKDGKQLAENGITRILNKCFGKKISSSMLRNIYLTDKYGDVDKEMDKDSTAMGTSKRMVTTVYAK